MNVHQDLLQIEQDFQVTIPNESRMTRWQDEHSLDVAHLTKLVEPLDVLLDLFASISIPTEDGSTQVESTLTILTKIMSRHEETHVALLKARDEITHLDSRHLLNQQRLSEFNHKISQALQLARPKVLNLNDETKHLYTERHILRNRLSMLEKERRTQDELILNMASKLNATEEENLSLMGSNKKLQMNMVRLKTHIQGNSMARAEREGRSLIREPIARRNSSRERGLAYAEKQAIKTKVAQLYDCLIRRYKQPQRASRKRSKSRSKSRTRVEVHDYYQELEPFANILREPMSKGGISPAKSMLLSKLKQVDLEIDQLARDLMLD